jgi:hypothetical protein
MLLSVCGNLSGVLFSDDVEHENIPGQRSIDGEAHLAATNTFIKACEKIDSILDDPKRWGIDFQLALEKQYNEVHVNQQENLKTQIAESEQRRITAAAIVLPHFRYRPALVRLEEGGWAAFLGDVNDLDSGILGLGDNPEAALASFDRAFVGEMTDEVKAWLKAHEDDIENGVETTTPFPKENNEKAMDGLGTSAVEISPGGGNVDPSNSGPAGAQPDIGIPKT